MLPQDTNVSTPTCELNRAYSEWKLTLINPHMVLDGFEDPSNRVDTCDHST